MKPRVTFGVKYAVVAFVPHVKKLSKPHKSWIYGIIESFKLERTLGGFSSTLLLKAGSALRLYQAAQGPCSVKS